MRGQIGAPAAEITHHGPNMRAFNAAGKFPARLQHLPAGIVYRSRGVVTAPDKRELIRDLGMPRQDLRELDLRRGRGNGLEGTPDLCGCVGFGVEGVELARCTEIENHDSAAVILCDQTQLLGLQKGGQGEARCGKGADLHKVPTV